MDHDYSFTKSANIFHRACGSDVRNVKGCFIIAEVGQNHQGDIDIAKKLIETASTCGADCVKFQKSSLQHKFTEHLLQKPYESVNSFGKTYGEHRRHLEFSEQQFIELSDHAKANDIAFASTGSDKVSIDFLNSINVPFFKIGSSDATNIPLLKYVASLGKPFIVSTGMTYLEQVAKTYDVIKGKGNHFAILHCISAYPTSYEDINLNVINTYKAKFPEAIIGYSGHEQGIGVAIAAVVLGAQVIEKHLTLDNSWKGSDHMASLDPDSFKQMVTEIRRVEHAMGGYDKSMLKTEMPCFNKLGKTVVATRHLEAGTVITEDMITVKCAGMQGWKPDHFYELIGQTLEKEVMADHVILGKDIKK